MSTLEDLDAALASAKTALHTAKVADGYARAAWQNAMQYLGIQPAHPVRGRSTPTLTPVATTDLPGLASTLISTSQAVTTAQAAVTAAQAAFVAAQTSAKIQT